MKYRIKYYISRPISIPKIQASQDSQYALIVPTHTRGSLGDLAMMLGLRQLLHESRGETTRVCKVHPDDDFSDIGDEFNGPQLSMHPSNLMRFRKALRQVSGVYVIGADVLDGKYSLERSLTRLHFADFCARLGVPATLCGFSMRDDPQPEIRRAIQGLHPDVRVCARDPKSHERISRMGSKVHQVADLAFLLPASGMTERVSKAVDFLAAHRSHGKRVIAICPNPHAMPASPNQNPIERQHAMRSFVSGVMQSLSNNADVVYLLLSHDTRGAYSDFDVCRDAASAASHLLSYVMPHETSPDEVKEILRHCDLLVTGRMHCGIAALGAEVPSLFLDYQGKVQGLLSFFGLNSSYQMTGSIEGDISSVADAAANMLSETESVRRQIRAALPAVRALARANCTPAHSKPAGT